MVFDRPMRSVDDLDLPVPVTLSPALAGRWRWLGTAAAEFESDAPLPRATSYELTVPAGTRASDGTLLSQAFSWSFEAEHPTLLSVEPHSPTRLDRAGEGDLPFDVFWRLTLNQPTSDEEFARAFRIEAGATSAGQASPVAFDLRRPQATDLRQVDVVPRAALAPTTAVTLTADPGRLRTTEEAGRYLYWTHRTPTPPTARIRCPGAGCGPDSGVILSFSSPVAMEEVLRAVEITPRPAKLVPIGGWSNEVYLQGTFRPGARTRVRLPGGTVRDVYGQLVPEVQATLPFRQHQAEIVRGVTGEYLEPGLVKALPIFTRGLSSVTVAVKRFDETTLQSSDWRWLSSIVPDARLVLHPKQRDGFAVSELSLEDLLKGTAERGAAWFALSRPGAKADLNDSQVRQGLVQVTDLALTVKQMPSGVLVWVSRLSTGKSLANAEVSVQAEGERINAKTDGEGLARIDWSGDRRGSIKLSARLGDEWVVWGGADGGWGAPSAGKTAFQPQATFGVLWADRLGYRPGDTVQTRGVARTTTTEGVTTPVGKSVEVQLVGPLSAEDEEQRRRHYGREKPEDVVATRSLEASAFGSFGVDFAIPTTAKPGRYEVRANGVEGAQTAFELTGSESAELSLCVDAEQTSYVRGASARLHAHGEARGDRGLAGYAASVACAHRATSYVVPGAEGFTTRDEASTPSASDSNQTGSQEAGDGAATPGELARVEGTLDAVGRLDVEQSLASVASRGPERVTCTVQLEATAPEKAAATTTFLVHPAEAYAGLRLLGGHIQEARKAVVLEALALAPSGTRQKGMPLQVELLKRSTRGGLRDERVGACEVVSAEEPVGCALVPPEPGRYVARATLADSSGHSTTASVLVFAVEAGASASGASSGDHRPEVDWGVTPRENWTPWQPLADLEVVLDKPSYSAGETARALVLSPFERAEALVTVESSKLHSTRRVVLSGSAPLIEVPISEEHRPNAFVSVVLIRGRTLPPPNPRSGADPGAPAVRAGYAEFLVDPERRRLDVRVRPTNVPVGADGRVEVEVEVTDSAGAPAQAEVTLMALDEHARSTGEVAAPDLPAAMTALRGDAVDTSDVRLSLSRLLPVPEVRLRDYCSVEGIMDCGTGWWGGEPSSPPIALGFHGTTDFRPGLVTDAKGRVRATLRLKQKGGPHGIFAFAVGQNDRYGAGRSRVAAMPSLTLRPFVPPRLHPGDTVDVAVMVHSTLPRGTPVELDAKAAGGVGVEGRTQTVEVGADGKAVARVRLSARTAGDATLTFHARAAGVEATKEVKRVVGETVPTSAVESGLYVEKRLTVVRPGETRATAAALPSDQPRAASGREFHVGDRVLVDLLVVAPEGFGRVSLEDSLPAGFESLEPPGGAKAPSTQPDSREGSCEDPMDSCSRRKPSRGESPPAAPPDPEKPTEVLPHGLRWTAETLAPGVHHRRYLVRLTSAGRFVLPPARVAAESPTAAQASTASSFLEVLP